MDIDVVSVYSQTWQDTKVGSAVKKIAILYTIVSITASISLRDAQADGSGDASMVEARLTPSIAQTALANLIRSKSCDILNELDADVWARKEIKDEGKATWSIGGLFYVTPKDAKYSFTVFPKPGVAACAISYEGKFKMDSGKWVAQRPEVKSYALQPGK